MPRCVKCQKRTGLLINDLCLICHEIWQMESTRFKHVTGRPVGFEELGEWVLDEEKFNAKMLHFTPCKFCKNDCESADECRY